MAKGNMLEGRSMLRRTHFLSNDYPEVSLLTYLTQLIPHEPTYPSCAPPFPSRVLSALSHPSRLLLDPGFDASIQCHHPHQPALVCTSSVRANVSHCLASAPLDPQTLARQISISPLAHYHSVFVAMRAAPFPLPRHSTLVVLLREMMVSLYSKKKGYKSNNNYNYGQYQ